MKKLIPKLLLKSMLAVSICGIISYAAAAKIEVYKSPTCKCCAKWVDHMRANGFTVETKNIWKQEGKKTCRHLPISRVVPYISC